MSNSVGTPIFLMNFFSFALVIGNGFRLVDFGGVEPLRKTVPTNTQPRKRKSQDMFEIARLRSAFGLPKVDCKSNPRAIHDRYPRVPHPKITPKRSLQISL